MDITREQLKKIMPGATDANIEKYLKPLNKAMVLYEINTSKRQAMFLGQIALESGELKYDTEIASGIKYEGRKDLGNTQPGDGVKYKGKGILQLTGKSNYRSMTKKLKLLGFNVDLVVNPELAKEPNISCMIAGQYFKDKKINDAADNCDIIKATRLINGGLNGLKQRENYWLRALGVLNCDL